MTIDVATINALQSDNVMLQINGSLRDSLGEDSKNVVAVKDGYSLVEVEKYRDQKTRFTGTFQTELLDEFVGYSKVHYSDRAICFVNRDALSAKIIFDFMDSDGGAVGFQRNMAVLKPATSPLWAQIQKLVAQREVSQKDLAFFLTDNDSCLAYNSGTIVPLSEAITAIRTLKINTQKSAEIKVGNLSQEKSLMEKIDADNNPAARVPDMIVYTLRPVSWLDPVEVSIRLSINTAEKDGQFHLIPRIVNPDQLNDRIAANFCDVVKDKLTTLGDDPRVFVGAFSL